jgi:hypothetical protein
VIKVARALAVLVTLAATLALALPASADTGHFQSATSSVSNAGALVVAFDERGLGGEDVDYLLTADASAIYACVNGGGNHPEAANKETINATVSTNATFEPRNGRVVAVITAGPPSAGGFACPNGQRLVLASVAYVNVVLADLTNAVQTDVADAARVLATV